jgi:hypothetical protein
MAARIGSEICSDSPSIASERGSLLDQLLLLLSVYMGRSRNMLAIMWGQDLREQFDILGNMKQIGQTGLGKYLTRCAISANR